VLNIILKELIGLLLNICSGIFAPLINITKALTGAKYNGEYLHKLIKNMTQDTLLSQTLTNVVIPSFDVQHLQPTIFSSYQVLLIFLFFYIDKIK